MNILYLADPNSIHDVKWIAPFVAFNNCYLVVRKHHYQKFKKNSIETESGPVPIVGVVDDVKTVWLWKNLSGVNLIKNIIKAKAINIFHIMYAEPNALWSLWRKQFGVPIILTTRGTDVLSTIPKFFEFDSILKKLVAKKYKKAFSNIDLFTCTSLRQQQNVLKILNIDKQKGANIRIIRTGIDVESVLAASDTSFYLANSKRIILMPRNMRPIYNHELVIESFRYLSPEIRSTYLFVFLNADTDDLSYINKIKKGLSLADVEYLLLPTISQPEMWSLIKKASLVVMTPTTDGTPVSALETMVCEIPIILGPLNYDQDIFTNTVFKLNNWDAKELADLMISVLSSNNALICSRAKEKVLLFGDRYNEMKKVEKIYHEIVSHSSTE